MNNEDIVRDFIQRRMPSPPATGTVALVALHNLVASRDTLERERDVALDRITALENEVERLKRTATQLRAQVASSVRRTYQ